MTGYGSASVPVAGGLLGIELSSVNRRSLELHIGLPREWQLLERELATLLKEHIARGKVSVFIRYERDAGRDAFTCNEEHLSGAFKSIESLAKHLNVDFKPDAQFLLSMVRQLGGAETLPEASAIETHVTAGLKEALESFLAMRMKEGEALQKDMSERIDRLESLGKEIAQTGDGRVDSYREALMARLEKLGLEIDLDDQRVLKEIALFADRCDISEELTRLDSHIAQFRELIQATEPIGRKMDFLCQELNRELNTMGSKANAIEITRLVVDGKNLLESIREQVQNIE